MSVLDDIAAQLVASSVGVLGTNIFLSSASVIPTGPGPYLTVSETGGLAPTRVANYRAPNTQRPTAQILVRSLGEQPARTMIKNAYFALDGIFNTTVNGVFYLSMTARQEPTDMGLDGSGRFQIVFNIDAEKSPS